MLKSSPDSLMLAGGTSASSTARFIGKARSDGHPLKATCGGEEVEFTQRGARVVLALLEASNAVLLVVERELKAEEFRRDWDREFGGPAPNDPQVIRERQGYRGPPSGPSSPLEPNDGIGFGSSLTPLASRDAHGGPSGRLGQLTQGLGVFRHR